MARASAGARNRLKRAALRFANRVLASCSCSTQNSPIVKVLQPGALQARTSGIPEA
jgi:hypothetical protein